MLKTHSRLPFKPLIVHLKYKHSIGVESMTHIAMINVQKATFEQGFELYISAVITRSAKEKRPNDCSDAKRRAV